MKHHFKPLFAALCLFAMLFAVALAADAQEQDKVQTLVLRQDVDQPIQSLSVKGMHNVSVIQDTADFFQIVTDGRLSDADSLRRPLQNMKLMGNSLVIPVNFAYANGINIHTTAKRLQIESLDDSHVQLVSAADTLRFEFLSLEARGHSTLLVPHPVVADQVVLRGEDYATLRYSAIDHRDLTRIAKAESRVEQRGVDDQEEAFPYRISPAIHRMFGGFSYAISGWSQAPFGGMEVPMGDYSMNITALGSFDLRFGWNILRLHHWDFGLGFALTAESHIFPRLMGTTVDPATGLTHFGPVDEPSYYNKPTYAGQTRVWRTTVGAVSMFVPIRMEWHRRRDYKGLRLSVELRPGIQLSGEGAFMRSQCTWTSGNEADNGRVDILQDTVGDIYNRFRCDLRLDIGWSHLSLYVQGALTPLFRTDRKDDNPAIDTKIYPLLLGISFNY